MYSTLDLPVDGHKLVALALNQQASGTPIILLHGVTLSVHAWITDDVFRRLGPCYALSLPGHYPATTPPGFCTESLTPQLMAHLLSRAIRQLVGPQQVLLVGHSTGGFAALAIAALEPDLVCGTITLAGFAQGRWQGAYGLYQRWVRHGLLPRLLFKAASRLNLLHPSLFRRIWHVSLADRQGFYAYPRLTTLLDKTYQSARQLDIDAIMHYFRSMPDIDISDLLPQIAAPVLAISGDRDPIVSPAQTSLIARKVPHSDVAFVAGAGHMLFLERPGEYARLVDGWLSRVRL